MAKKQRGLMKMVLVSLRCQFSSFIKEAQRLLLHTRTSLY